MIDEQHLWDPSDSFINVAFINNLLSVTRGFFFFIYLMFLNSKYLIFWVFNTSNRNEFKLLSIIFYFFYMQPFCMPGLMVFFFSILHISNMSTEANMVHSANPEMSNLSLSLHKSRHLCLTAFCTVTRQLNKAGALIFKHV